MMTNSAVIEILDKEATVIAKKVEFGYMTPEEAVASFKGFSKGIKTEIDRILIDVCERNIIKIEEAKPNSKSLEHNLEEFCHTLAIEPEEDC